MKTLIVYYSKSGNTRKVAEKIKDTLSCDWDEIQYDENAHTIKSAVDPAGYDRIILMCPIWAFSLPEPMTLYLEAHKAGISQYRLAVTCGLFGLRGCVSGCKKILGTPPEAAVKIRAKFIPSGKYSIAKVAQ